MRVLMYIHTSKWACVQLTCEWKHVLVCTGMCVHVRVCVRRRSICLPVWGSPGKGGFPLQHQRWRGARAYTHTHTKRVFLSLMPKQREEKTGVRCWEISSIKIVRAFSTGTFPHPANTQKWQVTRPGVTSVYTYTHTKKHTWSSYAYIEYKNKKHKHKHTLLTLCTTRVYDPQKFTHTHAAVTHIPLNSSLT